MEVVNAVLGGHHHRDGGDGVRRPCNTTEVLAVMLNAVLGVGWRPRRLAWVEVALFFAGRPEPVLGALGEAQGRLRRRRESSSAPSMNAARRRLFRRSRRS